MKLLLYSSSGSDEKLKIFRDFFQVEPQGLRLVLISNGYDESDFSEEERTRDTSQKKSKLEQFGFSVQPIDLREHTSISLQKILEESDVLWVRGGMCGTLLRAVQDSVLADLLPKFIDEGLLYVGSSAGSMILSEYLDAAAHYPGEEEPELEYVKGLGYVDFQIVPHAESLNKEEYVQNLEPGKTYYWLPDGCAIGIDDDQTEFYGEGIERIQV